MDQDCGLVPRAEFRVFACPGNHFVVSREVQWPIVSPYRSAPREAGYDGACLLWMHVQTEVARLVGRVQSAAW